MRTNENRDYEIVQLINTGSSYQEIASQFGLTKDRISQIHIRFQHEEKQKEQAAKIINEFKFANNIDQKWSTETITNGLLFPKRATRCLQKHFDNSSISELSLRDLMDFLIKDYDHLPLNIWEVSPAYGQKDLGLKTFVSLVNHLVEHDLGSSFNAEWINRLKKLMWFYFIRQQYIPHSLNKYKELLSYPSQPQPHHNVHYCSPKRLPSRGNMSYWNYRVIKKQPSVPDTTTYQVHEVYYDKQGRIEGWTKSAVNPFGETPGELREDIRFFTKAFQKPILEEKEENGKSVLIQEESFNEINDGHYLELLDRSWVSIDYIYQFLGSHPLMKKEKKLREIYEKAENALSELYQEIGQLEYGKTNESR